MKINVKVFILVLVTLLITLGRNLNPLSQTMFDFHDITQPARIQQFTLNLKNLKIPPRLAPDFSFKMGYPVFNFYAPFSYWVTGVINLLGFDVITSLKVSFLFSLIGAFVFTFLFLRLFFDFYPSLLGAVSYVTSLYFAVEIFVRGNLGEIWFIALFPLALFSLLKNSQKPQRKTFFLTAIIIAAILTAHNALSLIFIPVSLIFVLLNKNIKMNLAALFIGFLLTAYFTIPGVFELKDVYAKEITTTTDYHHHFLCPYQLWQSPWGYGGSIPGCNDGMSFKIGKFQLIVSLFGILIFLGKLFLKHKLRDKPVLIFFFFLTSVSLFLTTYQSQLIWDLLRPVFSLFQFPWRFIGLALSGIAFFIAYFWQKVAFPFKKIVIIFFTVALFIYASKYFQKNEMAKKDFINHYLSQEYIETRAAHNIPEYLPKSADYRYWQQLNPKDKKEIKIGDQWPMDTADTGSLQVIKNTPWLKEFKIVRPTVARVNIHYFPFWRIYQDGQLTKLEKFDPLGRPIINTKTSSIITVQYQETLIERIGDWLSLSTFIFLCLLTFNRSIWRKFQRLIR